MLVSSERYCESIEKLFQCLKWNNNSIIFEFRKHRIRKLVKGME